MLHLIAEREGETVKDYGEFETLEQCYDKVVLIDGPDAMDNPQWPEGCDVVVHDVENENVFWMLECDCWTEITPNLRQAIHEELVLIRELTEDAGEDGAEKAQEKCLRILRKTRKDIESVEL